MQKTVVAPLDSFPLDRLLEATANDLFHRIESKKSVSDEELKSLYFLFHQTLSKATGNFTLIHQVIDLVDSPSMSVFCWCACRYRG